MRIEHRPVAVVLSLLPLLLGLAQPLVAQSIRGRLLEQGSDRPIASAAVSLLPAANAQPVATTRTSNDGAFALTAPGPGIYRLMAVLPGYRTAVSPAMEFQANDQVDFTWRLLSDTVRLRPIAVTANARQPAGRSGGFYERMQRRSAFGHFIGRDQIEKQRPFTVSDLLRTIPGLVVTPSPAGFGDVVRTTEGCQPAIYLDGIRFPLMGESIDQIVNPMDLEGIEVYTHAAEVPVEFAGPGSSCGVIALWTRRGP